MRIVSSVRYKSIVLVGFFFLFFNQWAVGDFDIRVAEDLTKELKAGMWKADGGPWVANAAVRSPTGTYYWLFRADSIGEFDADKSVNIQGWNLARWQYDNYIPEEILERYSDYGLDANSSESRIRKFQIGSTSLGCLPDSPMRYGDFLGYDDFQVVVIFKDDIVVFIPKEGRVVFSQPLRFNDWLDETETEYYKDAYFSGDVPDDVVQYLSRLASEMEGSGSIDWSARGYRGYSKIYKGNFLDDDGLDLIVWHKLYQSRLERDPIRGFELVSDTFLHYRMVDGGYSLQQTPDEVVFGWIKEKNLKWKDGFPSKSECEGEEGRLIPEMHDPLLNDPDVLQ